MFHTQAQLRKYVHYYRLCYENVGVPELVVIQYRKRSNERQKKAANMVNLTQDTFDGAVAQGVTLVDFWATWCGPCKIMGAVLEEQLAPQLEPLGVKVGKVNIEDAPALAARFEVMAIPTLLLFSDGKAVARMTGVQKPQDVLDKVKELKG